MQIHTTDFAAIRHAGRTFVGADFGDLPISFIMVDSAPGNGPDLYVHPYQEVFVIQSGEATFTIDGQEIVARAGQVVVAPREKAHKFINSGSGRLRSINIHPNAKS